MQKVCEHCNKIFILKVLRRRNPQKFCSFECYRISKIGKKAHPSTAVALRTTNIGRIVSKKSRELMSAKAKLRRKLSPEERQRRDRISKIYYRLVGRCVDDLKYRKQNKTIEELGYTPLQFRHHLESRFKEGMCWENHGRGKGKWHVDHVRPISSFPEGSLPSVVNALENLQPLWEEENLSKNSKWVQT